MRRQLTGIDLE